MLARHIPDIIIIFSLEQIMVNKCAAPSCRSGYTKNKIKHKISFSFEKFQTEQVVDSICQPQRLEANKTLFYVGFILKRSTSSEVESQI